MANRFYSTINELKERSRDEDSDKPWKIKVRVSRLRHVTNPKDKKELWYICMVLIDEEGDYIYATITPKLWADRFHSKIIDGKVHLLKNFGIGPNLSKYRIVSDNKLMIKFYYGTFVKIFDNKETIIPQHKFDFIHFNDLDKRRDNHTVLTDLIGVFVKDDFRNGKYFAVDIKNEGGQSTRIAIWDQCVTDYLALKEKYDDDDQTKIIIVTSVLVRDYKGYNSVATSTSSRIYMNLDIPEVNEFKFRASLTENNGEDKPEEPSHQALNKDMSSIIEHCKLDYEQDLICYCHAKVKDIGTERLWHYTSCFGCTNKPVRRKIESDLWCSKCKKTIETQTIRYCIDLKVEDQSCKATFVLFDNEARKLIGQDATTLYDAQPIEDEDDEDFNPVPKLIQNIFVGKEFMFKIKIQRSNHEPECISTYKVLSISEKSVTKLNEEAPFNSLTNGEKSPTATVVLDESDEQESDVEETLLTFRRKRSKAKVNSNTASAGRKNLNSVVMLDEAINHEHDEEETLPTVQSKRRLAKTTSAAKKRLSSVVMLDEAINHEQNEEEALPKIQNKRSRTRGKAKTGSRKPSS